MLPIPVTLMQISAVPTSRNTPMPWVSNNVPVRTIRAKRGCSRPKPAITVSPRWLQSWYLAMMETNR